MEEVKYPTMGDIRVDSPVRPQVPVKQEINRSFQEDEMEDLLEELDRKEGRLVLKMLEVDVGDKGRLNLAHQLFLYGVPEGPRKGIPIRNINRLAKVCGLNRALLTPHVRPWTREAMRIARDSSPIHAFACSKEAREMHLADLKRMREGIESIEEAIRTSPAGSRQWIQLHQLLKEARKEWQDASGVTSGVKISEEAAKLQAKMLVDAMKEENAEREPASPRRVSGQCFDVD